MPDELKSFLVSVAAIIAITLLVPCIESVVKMLRRNAQHRAHVRTTQMKRAKEFSGEAA